MDARRLAAVTAVLCLMVLPAAAHAAGGYLAPGGCLGLQEGCDHTVPDGFDAFGGLVSVVAGDDGTSAYGLSECCVAIDAHQTAVVRMRRAADGSLSFAGCLGDPAGGGCTQLPP